jgi:hypothetical protein
MLILADRASQIYRIAVNNASNSAELVSDLSFLADAPPGVLTFDLSHMAAPLTLEKRVEYRPGSFGYQPSQNLLEVTSVIVDYMGRSPFCPHQVQAILPARTSRVGQYLQTVGLPNLLAGLGLQVSEVNPPTVELGDDDVGRQNLIPLTRIVVTNGRPDFAAIAKVRQLIKKTFDRAVSDQPQLADIFTAVVSEAVDNLVEYGQGGLIGGLFYPRAGEVEITLVNRSGGFGGNNPDQELEALVTACEGKIARNSGGNGIKGLRELTEACFGTVMFRNGSATLRFTPDGSLVAFTAETGLPSPGAYVTIVLQLLPSGESAETPALKEYRGVLRAALNNYLQKRGRPTLGRADV